MIKKTNSKRRVTAFVFAVALCLLSIIPLSTVSVSADDSGVNVSECQHVKFLHLNDGTSICRDCSYSCEHNYNKSYNSLNAEKHSYQMSCSVCARESSAAYENHTFLNGVCSACGYVCLHDFVAVSYDVTSCKYCSYVCEHNTNKIYYQSDDTKHYFRYFCSDCNFLIGDLFNYEEHVYDTEFYVDKESSDYHSYHGQRKVCKLCGYSYTPGWFVNHIFTNGICQVCGYACEHEFDRSTHLCKYCNLEHLTHQVVYTPIYGTRSNGNSFLLRAKFSCNVYGCDYNVDDISPMRDNNVLYYAPLPFTLRWNTDIIRSYTSEHADSLGGIAYRPYCTFSSYNWDATHDYKATVNLTKRPETLSTPMKTARYMVMRVRLHHVESFELSIYGGLSPTSINGLEPGSGSGDFKKFNISVDTISKQNDDKWITLVFDLYSTDCYMSINGNTSGYPIDGFIDTFASYLCAKFTSSDGHVDCEFVSLVYSLDEVDSILHWYSYSERTERYYLYSGDKYIHVTRSHSYENGVCRNCDTKCPHTNFVYGYCSECRSFISVNGYQNEMGMFSLFTSVYDAQMNTFMSMLNYDILGVNIASLIIALVVIIISVIIFKKVI